jgi:hypothetical protein
MRRRINASVDFFTRALIRFDFSRIPEPWNFTSGNCQTIGTAGTIELLIPTVAYWRSTQAMAAALDDVN